MSNGPGAAGKQPNILFIMADDIGWMNVDAYHRGIMEKTNPNLEQLANEGAIFTDYYAEASCTAGRANFITGQLPHPHRADHGRPGGRGRRHARRVAHAGHRPQGARATPPGSSARTTSATSTSSCRPCTASTSSSATSTTSTPWRTRSGPDYPQDLVDTVGPRNLIHSFASDTDDETEEPRWGKVGKQTITDEGPLPPHPMDGIKYNMETFDEVIRDSHQRLHRAGGQPRTSPSSSG